MAQINDGGFHPSSPHSPSDMPDSFKGTPDTRLTAFSPENDSSKGARLSRGLILGSTETLNRNLQTENDHSGSSSLVDKDPFVTNFPVTDRPLQKLSPTACAFKPFLGKPQLAAGSPEGSLPNLHDVQALSTNLSKDIGISRYLIATSPSNEISSSDVEIYLTQGTVTRHGKHYVFTRSVGIYLAFTDLRDAFRAFEKASNLRRDWAVKYLTAAEFFNQVGDEADPKLALDGVLNIVASTTSSTQLEPDAATAIVRGVIRSYGQIFALVNVSGFESGSMRAIIEFCDMDAAAAATAGCNGTSFDGIYISTFPSRFAPVTTRPWSMPGHTQGATQTVTHTNDLRTAFQNLGITGSHPTAQAGPLPVLPASARNCQPIGVQVHPFMVPFLCQPQFPAGFPYMLDRNSQRMSSNVAVSTPLPFMGPIFAQPTFPFQNMGEYPFQHNLWGFGNAENRRQHATRINRGPHYNTANHHNHVDIERIRGGQDVRTTIMLRNIPNKVTQEDLKQIVDQSSLGKYDFMYLRIDFANDCNVGYAFINFVDPLDIVDFVRARANQRWNCYKSDKVAEISYATIQGKDCLVQKFRNSSVMLEAPHYRPKLYYTFNGPNPLLAGEEEPFPEPDNASKMKRSCENAEHVGLFTPNAGQHFRDEQRRRRSQFDRGTRLAALEEYDYEAASMQSMYSPH